MLGPKVLNAVYYISFYFYFYPHVLNSFEFILAAVFLYLII